MKKKYLYGMVGGVIAIILAVFLFLLLGMKCSFRVSAGQGYTVTVKGIELDKKGTTEVRKGEKVVFAVVLDRDYSDSNLKVMANDTELTGKDGVYRYTVENDTTITIDGVTENDYIVQGVDIDQETLSEEGFILLRDENKRPVPVLSDIAMSGVDRTDIPNLNLTASVLESMNPGWKFRELTAVNLGKYSAAKFYVKHSNYLEAKFSFGEKFYEKGGNDAWHEFSFQNDEGMMTLYVDGEKIGSCNYLSDILFCLQDKGSYKFSHIYVIPKDDYQGGMLSVEAGEGYQMDIPAREYAIGATLQFHVTLDEGFMKGKNFAVKAGNQVLKEREDGSYTFVFNGDTTIRVIGVVAKPLDSRYQVIGTPMRAEWEETANYILVQDVADSKTYTHTQPQWGSVGFEELELKQYSNLLFFMKKDDTDPKKWVEILQTADDGTVTPYLQKNDNVWHKIEIKKEGGQMYFYLDGERNSTPIIDTEHLSFVMNEGLELRITSLLAIKDPNYVPPEPDYISTAYQVIGIPMAVEGEEIENYILVSQAEDAKTYEHTPPGWRGFNMVEMDFAPYKSLLFFVHKEDVNEKTYLEVIKGDPNQIPHEADYVATNNNKWYKIELVKNAQGTLDVYVNDVKHDVTIANTKDLMVTISANATLTYTSLFGISDPAYVPPEPDYIDEEYETIASSLATDGEETTNYELVSKTENAKTYQITPPGWRGLTMTEVDIAPYESLIFFVHKEDVNSQTYLEVLKGDPNHIPHEADYVSTTDNKWYKIELVKNNAGELDVYVNDVKHDVSIASVKDLTITISANATLMYTSVFGKADPNYVPPQPDYIDSEYKTITSSLVVDGEEITNYELVSQTENAKTYQFVAPGWRGLSMAEMDIAPYESLLFFVHKDDVNTATYLEVLKGDPNHIPHEADYVSTNGNKWYKIELVKNDAGELDVYVDDVKYDVTIASLEDLTITISANATLMYTSLFGIEDPNYVEPEPEPDYIDSQYQTIQSAFDFEGDEITNYELVSQIADAKTYQFVAPGWRGFGLKELEEARYQSLILFVHKDDVSNSTWLELYKGVVNGTHHADYISTNNNEWYKVELIKTATNEWDVYVNDVKHDTTIASVTDLTFTISGGATLMYTSVFGIADPNYVEPTPEVEDVMVVTSPWTYYRATMDNSNTYTEAGYEYATKIQGYYQAYDFHARMKDVDLSLYSEFRFAVKSSGGSYSKYEVKLVGDNTTFENDSLFTGANETSWTEYVFKCEDDGTGTEKFHMYKAGEATDVWLPSDMNLSDLQMRASYDTSAVMYMTELRGVVKEGAESELKVVAPSFNNYTGDSVESERPIQFATASTKVATSWSGTKSPLADIALDGYKKIIFYARQYEGSGYFESDYFGTDQFRDAWVEFKLVKNADQTWNLYCGGVLKTESVVLHNLNEVHATYGNGNYYFSQVFGVEADETQEPLPEPTQETLILATPWSYHDSVHHNPQKFSVLDKTQAYAAGGYEYANIVPGGQVYYDAPLMQDMDMSVYSEFRFAVKTNGSYWYEAGLAANNDFGAIVGAETEWTEYVFKYEEDGTNTGYHLYKGGNPTNTWFPADLNLSDIRMRFSSNTSARFYITEVRGILKEGSTHSLQAISDNFHGLGEDLDSATTKVEEEKPNGIATGSTQAKTAWRGDANGNMKYFPLANVSLASYEKILFYVRKTAEDGAWLQSGLLGDFVVGTTWTEFRLEKNANGNWDIYVSGRLYKSNQTLRNLSDITVALGTSNYYFSEVFGVPTVDNRPVLVGEHVVLTTPWSYHDSVHHNPQKFSVLDKAQAYTAGGYEYANIVPGGQVYYDKPLMQDMDMSVYSEFRFAVKTNGNYWYEAGLAANNDFGAIVGNETEWTEYVFKYEENGTNTGYRLYKGGNVTNTWFPADLNLSDIRMRFSSNTSARFYITEVRGTLKEGQKVSLWTLSENFHGLGEDLDSATTKVETEKPNGIATGSTQAKTAWRGDANGNMKYFTLANVPLTSYNKFLFYIRKPAEDGAWLQSGLLGDFVVGTTWTEFKLEKNASGNWDIYVSGRLFKSNQTLSNLSDMTAAFGTSNYYFSEVFGVK